MGARRKQHKQKSWMNYRRWYRPLILIVLVVSGWQLSERIPAEIMPIENVKIEGAFVYLSRDDIQQQLKQLSGLQQYIVCNMVMRFITFTKRIISPPLVSGLLQKKPGR